MYFWEKSFENYFFEEAILKFTFEREVLKYIFCGSKVIYSINQF